MLSWPSVAPEALEAAAQSAAFHLDTLRRQPGYDHSYLLHRQASIEIIFATMPGVNNRESLVA